MQGSLKSVIKESIFSSFAIILKKKIDLVALFLMSLGCLVTLCSLALPHCAVVWSAVCDCGFPDHNHLLFHYKLMRVHY